MIKKYKHWKAGCIVNGGSVGNGSVQLGIDLFDDFTFISHIELHW